MGRATNTMQGLGRITITDTIPAITYDANGNIMATYKTLENEGENNLLEHPLYGSSRLGIYNGGTNEGYRTLANKQYELSNHLGNVLTTITDKKVGIDSNNDQVANHYVADISSISDYYPFGLAMKERSMSEDGYRFGFNGKENDKDLSSGAQDYGLRINNKALGRFLSVDPLGSEFPWNSSYAFAENRVIDAIDLEGAELYKIIDGVSTGLNAAITVFNDFMAYKNGTTIFYLQHEVSAGLITGNVRGKGENQFVLNILEASVYGGISYGTAYDRAGVTQFALYKAHAHFDPSTDYKDGGDYLNHLVNGGHENMVLGGEINPISGAVKYHTAKTFGGTLDGFAASSSLKWNLGGEFGWDKKNRSYALSLGLGYGASFSITEDELFHAISISNAERELLERVSGGNGLEKFAAKISPEVWIIQNIKRVEKNGESWLEGYILSIPISPNGSSTSTSMVSPFKVFTKAKYNGKKWISEDNHWKSDAYREEESKLE